MPGRDWIPKREQDFVDLCEKWIAVLLDPVKVAEYGWVQAECDAVADTIHTFLTARNAYETDNSSANRLTKDEARENAVNAMRDFANASIRFNKKMDDAAKLAMGVHPQDTTPTIHGRPTSQPDTVVENTVNHFEHKVKALNHATNKAGKPADAYGVRYAWQVGGERPASGEKIMGKTLFSRKASHIVTHNEADKATTCYYATCYENSRGDQGSWSPVEEAVIG
jgi:hypothetical protein